MDRIEKNLSKFEAWFPPLGSLVLCSRSGEPALIEIDGQDFLFLFSAETTDEQILANIQTIQRAGFRGPFKAFRADLNPDLLIEGAGELFTMLLDCPLANTFEVESISF